MKPRKTPVLTLFVFVLIALAGCGGTRSWDDADAFRRQLRCGMSPERVSELSLKYGGPRLQVTSSNQHWSTHAFRVGGTVFWFGFPDHRLLLVQQGQYYGITGLRKSVRLNLCSGDSRGDVTLRITAPAQFAGANVMIDGVRRVGLSYGPDVEATIGGVPSGSHEIRIEKVGYEPIIRRYVYDAPDYWPPSTPVEIRIGGHEIRTKADDALLQPVKPPTGTNRQ